VSKTSSLRDTVRVYAHRYNPIKRKNNENWKKHAKKVKHFGRRRRFMPGQESQIAVAATVSYSAHLPDATITA
jgi:hypothetical protein